MESGIFAAFSKTVERLADRPALIDDERSVTFAEWHARALDHARRFVDAGGTAGDRVLLWMDENRLESAAAILGLLAAGAIPTALNASVAPAHARAAVRSTRPVRLLRLTETALPELDLKVPVDAPDSVPARGDRVPSRGFASPAPTDAAAILFTSGSTGAPKGVTVTHGGLLSGYRAVAGSLGLRDDDRVLGSIPWSFSYGFGQLIVTALCGVPLVLSENHPAAVCAAIERHRPTWLPGIPSSFAYLLSGMSPLKSTDLRSLRGLTNTGGTIPRPVLDDMLETFGHCELHLTYGLTECCRTTTLDPALVRERPGSIGRALPGVEVVILRSDGSVADPGEVGEIVHCGIGLFAGYWDDAEATAAALRRDPRPGAKEGDPPALYTGDLGHMDPDGYVTFHGRRDNLLKSMGVRVSPGEVERLLYESDLLRQVAVCGRPHPLLGHEICAVVVPKTGGAERVAELRKYARSVMSPYMEPRRYLVRTELPKTATGKVDYKRLETELDAG